MTRLAALVLAWCALAMVLVSPVSASVPGLEFTETGCEGHSDSVARLCTAGLGREPEEGGFEFWMDRYSTGSMGLLGMANYFAASPEFGVKFGSLDQAGFIDQMYLNVLKRPADAGGLEYWDGRMTSGLTRGQLLMNFSESPENITRSGTVEPILGPYNNGLSGSWNCSAESNNPTSGGGTPAGPVDTGNPGNTKNCSDFATQAEAQVWFDFYYPAYGDVANLDADEDRIPCEGLE